MAHLFGQIRAAAVAALTGGPTAGARVTGGLSHVVPGSGTPRLAVHVAGDRVGDGAMGKRLLRTVAIEVHGWAEGTDCETTLDTLLVEVESGLTGDATLNALVKRLAPAATEIDVATDGDRPVGQFVQTWEALAETAQADPETAL